MLHWALLQHENLWGGAESDFFSPLIQGAEAAWAKGTKFGEHHWLIKEHVSRPEFFGQIGQAIDQLYLSRSNGLRWVEQTPHYVLQYSGLNAMFPGARFIHIVRDGRQVICSMQEKFGWSYLKAMRHWKHLVETGNALNEQGRDNFLQVRYESILLDPKAHFQEIYRFIGESYEPLSVKFLEKPINTSPQRENESSLAKLEPRWDGWNTFKRLSFKFHCGKLMQQTGYADPDR